MDDFERAKWLLYRCLVTVAIYALSGIFLGPLIASILLIFLFFTTCVSTVHEYIEEHPPETKKKVAEPVKVSEPVNLEKLSRREKVLVKEVLSEANNRLLIWKKAIQEDKVLAAIESDTLGLRSLKGILDFLSDNPKDIIREDFSGVLNRTLPGLMDLLTLHKEVRVLSGSDSRARMVTNLIVFHSESITNAFHKNVLRRVDEAVNETEMMFPELNKKGE